MGNMLFPPITENEKMLPFFLVGVGCHHIQENVLRPNGYPYFQWIQCYEGEGELITDNKKIKIKKDQGMLLYPNKAHEYYALQHPWKVDWITFDGYGVETFLKNIGFIKSDVFFVSHCELIISKIRKIFNMCTLYNALTWLESSEFVYGLLTDLKKYTSRNENDSIQKHYAKLHPVLKYIDENYDTIITLDALGNTINVTPEYLCFLFKNSIGIRPFEYINSIRISKCKDLLINDNTLTINDICKLVGFEDASYFCSVFKKYEGISPGKFKKLH